MSTRRDLRSMPNDVSAHLDCVVNVVEVCAYLWGAMMQDTRRDHGDAERRAKVAALCLYNFGCTSVFDSVVN